MAVLDLQGMDPVSESGAAHHSSGSRHSCNGGGSWLSLLLC
jgi:hypothetical protein